MSQEYSKNIFTSLVPGSAVLAPSQTQWFISIDNKTQMCTDVLLKGYQEQNPYFIVLHLLEYTVA
jgi:hypothetical protein